MGWGRGLMESKTMGRGHPAGVEGTSGSSDGSAMPGMVASKVGLFPSM